ncbi:MAG: DNA primase [Candidatus Marinimicrobia bacterium]|nr:DNA primase [Candidatus Neomarinimicrobiota bacterium]|tara:strand:- start:846 stop:2594 length:1749 start_codon:yes stop_codon:yes gene_type:complete
MSKIPETTIDIVRDTADIVDIVSQYVDLKQRGANFFGLCPFHSEKTASFSVAPAKQIYHCFGCNSGGNVFSFIMEYQKISFPEAVKLLADHYNISIELDNNDTESEIFSALYNLHYLAMELYQNNLFSDDGGEALKYLYDRGFTENTLKQFNVGVSRDSWDQLVKHVKGKGFTKHQINQSGLFIHSDKGVFDRFRNRIMFPIFHPSGKPIAFGGRIYNSDDPAKYLNSPETPLYHKSNIFYGLHATRDSIRREESVILVEGYMDFLKLYQSSIPNILAISGTAFTKKHVISLNRISKKVILLYDGDSAGGNAVLKAGWILLQGGLEPLVVRPPEGLDPDDWIDKAGKKNVLNEILSPQPYIYFNIAFNKGKTLQGSDRKQFINNLAREIKNIDDGIVRNDMIRIVSDQLMVEEQDFIRTMKTQRIIKDYINEEEITSNKSLIFTSKVDKAQVELIKLLFCADENIRKYVKSVIKPSLFTIPIIKKIYNLIIDENLSIETSSFIEYFQDRNERDFITKLLFNNDNSNAIEEIVTDCLIILKSEPLKQKISKLRVEIREKESRGQDSSEELSALTELRKELNDL